MPIEQIPGVHGGTVFHDGRGHIYRRQREFRGVTYMVCASSTCPGRGSSIRNGDLIEETRPHNHDPDLDLPRALILRKSILERCRKEKLSIREIYRQEIEKAGDLANHEVLCSMLSSLQRARSSIALPFPSVPESLTEIQELFKKTEYSRFAQSLVGDPFFLDVVPSGHGDFSAVFISPYTKKLLKECEAFHIDATFQYVPVNPPCLQLMTITALLDDTGFPVVFVLMSKCSRMAYVTVLRRILQEEPQWVPSIIVADFENILHSALDEVFGTTGLTAVVGCWYQYTKALWIKLRTLPSLAEDSNALLCARMAMALPALPPPYISSGLSEIVTFIITSLKDEQLDQMLEFLQYVDEEWIEKYGPDKLSVYDLDHKLLYDIETLHHRIMVYVQNGNSGSSPGFWEFIIGLQKFDSDQYKTLKIVEEKGRIPKSRTKRYYRTQNKQIRKLCIKLYSGDVTVREFLKGVAQRVYRKSSQTGSQNEHKEDQAEDNIIHEEIIIKSESEDDCSEAHTLEDTPKNAGDLSGGALGSEALEGEVEILTHINLSAETVSQFHEEAEISEDDSRKELTLKTPASDEDADTYYVLVVEDH